MRASVKRPGLFWPSLITLGALAVLVATETSAVANGRMCKEKATVLNTLNRDYGEKPVAYGVTNNGALLRLIASPEGKTWTIVVQAPNGTTCLMAAGQGWRKRPKANKVAHSKRGPR